MHECTLRGLAHIGHIGRPGENVVITSMEDQVTGLGYKTTPALSQSKNCAPFVDKHEARCNRPSRGSRGRLRAVSQAML